MDSGQSGQHDGDPDPCPANDGLIMLCTRCASGRARSNGHHFTSVVAYLCLCVSLSISISLPPAPSLSGCGCVCAAASAVPLQERPFGDPPSSPSLSRALVTPG